MYNHVADDLADRINNQLWKIDRLFFESVNYEYDEHEENRRDFRSEIEIRLKDVHEDILCFLEMKELPKMLARFEDEFNPKILSDRDKLLENNGGHEDYDPELILPQRFRKYLSVFPEFNIKKEKEGEFEDQILNGPSVLLSVLKSTQHIIENARATISNETSIYSEVEWVLRLIFESTRRRNKARFISNFGSYVPDLLIPELFSAVEYKFIRDKGDLETHINDVRTDANTYVNDPEYKIFYAVFYIASHSITTENSFKAAWASKSFPSNWHPVVVFGKS